MKQQQMKKEMELCKREKENYSSRLLRHSFHIFSISLLSLLLPFSFLLVARLTSSSITSILPPSHLASALLRVDMPFLSVLVTVVSVGAAAHALTGRRIRPLAPVAWACLCAMQLCITVAVEATIATRVRVISSGAGRVDEHVAWIKQAILFVGLYKTMRFWGKTVVKPVVDDAVFGGELEEAKSDKLVVCVAFTTFWMYLLQDEVGPMVFGAVERGLARGMDWDDYVRWLVSHATVATGIVRIIQVFMGLGRLLLWNDEEEDGGHNCSASADEKVCLVHTSNIRETISVSTTMSSICTADP